MKKLAFLFFLTTAFDLRAMDGAPQPVQPLTIAPNANDFVASFDNEHNAQIRYFTEKYFPASVVLKFGDKQIKPEQQNLIIKSLVLDFSLGNRINEQRSLDLTPVVKTLLENGYIENYHEVLAQHPLIAPHIRAKELEFQHKITMWNDKMEKEKIGNEFLVTELETQPTLPPDLNALKLQLQAQALKQKKYRKLINDRLEELKLPKDLPDEQSSYKRFLPSNAWIKYPAVIGLSVLFSDHIRYAFWGAVKNAPIIWAKYLARSTATTPPSN